MNLDFLDDLLVNSHDGNYNNINEVIVQYFSEIPDAGIHVQPFADNKANVIISWGKPELLINVHTDTVVPADGWTKEPYKLTVDGNNLYGLGICDTKSNIFAVFEALKKVIPKNLMLLFSFDEESNGIESGVTHFLDNFDCSKIKKAVICEPTNNIEYYANLGYYSYFISTRAIAHHSSNNELLRDNAIFKMGDLMRKLVDAGFNLGTIEGGTAGNIIADKCTMLVSARTLLSENEVDKLLTDITGSQTTIIKKACLPAFCNQEYLSNQVNVANILGFWTEAALFFKKGINSIVYGAGNISQAHSQNEFVTLDSLFKAINYFTNLISNGVN